MAREQWKCGGFFRASSGGALVRATGRGSTRAAAVRAAKKAAARSTGAAMTTEAVSCAPRSLIARGWRPFAGSRKRR